MGKKKRNTENRVKGSGKRFIGGKGTKGGWVPACAYAGRAREGRCTRQLCADLKVGAYAVPARQGARKRITAAESRAIVAARARAHLASVKATAAVSSDDGNKKNRFCAAKRRGKSAKKRWELYRRALAERRAAYNERRQAFKKMKKEDPVRPHGSGNPCFACRSRTVGVCARSRPGTTKNFDRPRATSFTFAPVPQLGRSCGSTRTRSEKTAKLHGIFTDAVAGTRRSRISAHKHSRKTCARVRIGHSRARCERTGVPRHAQAHLQGCKRAPWRDDRPPSPVRDSAQKEALLAKATKLEKRLAISMRQEPQIPRRRAFAQINVRSRLGQPGCKTRLHSCSSGRARRIHPQKPVRSSRCAARTAAPS